jgi:hypothetical protein
LAETAGREDRGRGEQNRARAHVHLLPID